MRLAFAGALIEWRGPAPHHFVPMPVESSAEVADVARQVSYGWGVVPVEATIGATTFTTSLIPREGGYLLPVKAAVRRAEGLEPGDHVSVVLHVGPSAARAHDGAH